MQYNKPDWLQDVSVGLINMSRVVTAIILRETKTRFGKNKLGYLWAFIEPMAYVTIFILIREKAGTAVPFGSNLYLFILTGILVYRIFISIAGRANGSISSNQALLTYPLVKPVDTIVARIILESLTMILVLTVFFTILEIYSDYSLINYPSILIEAVAVLVLLSSGVGFFNAVFCMIFPAWERVWGLMTLPLLIMSGVFYVPKSMPPLVQQIISWNPLTHCVEWFRYGAYLDYDPALDRSYVIWFGITALTLGFLLEKIFRNGLVRS